MDFSGTASSYLAKLVGTLQMVDHHAIDHALSLIYTAWQNENQVIVFGNGGSAMTAQHYITDWNKSIYLSTQKPFHGRCLTENMGLITAYANDVSYYDVFIEQLKPILKPNDLVIGISGSGNSENVLRAIRYANEHKAVTLGICGYDGGKLKNLAQHQVWVNVNDMQLSEDIHLIFGHIVMQKICGYLNPPKISIQTAEIKLVNA